MKYIINQDFDKIDDEKRLFYSLMLLKKCTY